MSGCAHVGGDRAGGADRVQAKDRHHMDGCRSFRVPLALEASDGWPVKGT